MCIGSQVNITNKYSSKVDVPYEMTALAHRTGETIKGKYDHWYCHVRVKESWMLMNDNAAARDLETTPSAQKLCVIVAEAGYKVHYFTYMTRT